MSNLSIIFLLLTAVTTLTIAIYAFVKREEPAALPYAVLMLACTIHAFGYAFELYSKDPNIVMLWLNFEYIGIAFYPFILVWMAYTQRNDEKVWLNVVLVFFFALSVVTFALVQTNSFHHFYYETLSINYDGLSYVSFKEGPWYYVHSLSLLISFIILGAHNVLEMIQTRNGYRHKAFNAIVALVLPLATGVFYILDLTPDSIEVLPFLFGPLGLLWLVGFIQYGVFDLMPMTYKKIFENISEGVIVLDDSNQVVSFNMAAFHIFKYTDCLHKGNAFESILNEVTFVEYEDYTGKVFKIQNKDKELYFQLKKNDLYNKNNKHAGKIIVLNDISKEIEANTLLKTLATKDALTGIHNRRHFFDLCQEKIELGKQQGKRISFVLMDIDYFKAVNDTYGHLIGDDVLKKVSEICYDTLRETDLIGRYGGEEFGILIYDAGIQVTHSIIERMRKAIQNHAFKVGETETIHLTVSFGIYRPDLGEDIELLSIFTKADKGLYKAKSDGRDRIVFYSDYIN